jgi:metal-responsive CopG/Arc/MetJ family transcriptional regulator
MIQKRANRPLKRSASARVPVTVRIPQSLIDQIDEALDHRDIPQSRNNWLIEAAVEKLKRNSTGGSNGSQ